MKQWVYILIAMGLSWMLGMSTVETFAAKATGENEHAVSAVDAVKIAENVGRILSLHRHEYPKKTGHYYRITVVDSTENEVQDLYIDAKTGKIVQRIEHPAQMPPGGNF